MAGPMRINASPETSTGQSHTKERGREDESPVSSFALNVIKP